MDDAEIIKQTLYKLDGWVLEDNIQTDDLSDMDYNKSVTQEEVLHFYDVAYNYALAYTGLNTFPVVEQYRTIDGESLKVVDIDKQVFTALILWTAGLIWRKYNIRSNDNIDETYTVGYGDSLIIQAKEMLKSSKTYGFYAY